jgi:predicted nucleotidyltransferase
VDQLREVVGIVDAVLGREAIGTYLHGSFVLGGLRPASDLDVLVVARHAMSDEERTGLLARLLPVSGFIDGLRPVELRVVSQSAVRRRYAPTGDFLYGEWLRDRYESGEVPQPEPMPQLALLLTTVLAGNHALAGAPPSQVLDPVPHEDMVRASVAEIPSLLDDLDTDTRNVVLTIARIWVTLATGEIVPKDRAASWASAGLPATARPVLDHARQLYLGYRYAEETWTDELKAQVRPCVDQMLAAIGRLTPR